MLRFDKAIIVYFLSDLFWLIQRIISLILFDKLSELLPAFSCARAIGNHWSICLDVNILSPVPLVALVFASDTIKK